MPAQKRRWCRHGHDTHQVGRNTEGCCRACTGDYQRRYKERKIAWLHALKKGRGCKRCRYKESGYALDFHHRDPAAKSFTIGHTLNRSRSAILKEIEKCDVLCRNCHAILHHDREAF